MAQMLFRSPTGVPGIAAQAHAWSKQFLLKNWEELIQIPENWELSIQAVAAMGEAQVEDTLLLSVDSTPDVLPLWYLTQLWPGKFDLKRHVLLARSDKLWVRKPDTLDSIDIAVVLFGQYIVK